MTPTDKGKFCMHCSKQVLDLANLKDEEIVSILEKMNGNICAKLDPYRINKPIIISRQNHYSKLYTYLTTLFIFGSVPTLFAIPVSVQTKIASVSYKNFERIDLKKSNEDSLIKIFRGQVFTEIEGFEEPIPDAEVFVKELNLKTDTDIDGNFSVSIPTDYANDFLTLSITYLGFENVKVSFHKTDWLNKSIFYLKENEGELMGEVAIIYVKKRWWEFWK